MREVTQIPGEILNEASTEELVELALKYPLPCDMNAFDTDEEGYLHIMRGIVHIMNLEKQYIITRGADVMKRRAYLFSMIAMMAVAGCSASQVSGGTNESQVSESITDEITESESVIMSEQETEATEPETTIEETTQKAKIAEEQQGEIYETSVEPLFSADEWLGEDGIIDFPMTIEEVIATYTMYEDRMRAWLVPQEAMDAASTEELVDLCLRCCWVDSYGLFDTATAFFEYLDRTFNAISEVEKRDDFVEAVFEAYTEVSEEIENVSEDDNNKAVIGKIYLCEIFLASDDSFDKLSDDMKQQLIKLTEKNLPYVDEDPYNSGFYAYINELKYNEGESKWYDYLAEDETQLKYLEEFAPVM